jgi:hypothetical protein
LQSRRRPAAYFPKRAPSSCSSHGVLERNGSSEWASNIIQLKSRPPHDSRELAKNGPLQHTELKALARRALNQSLRGSKPSAMTNYGLHRCFQLLVGSGYPTREAPETKKLKRRPAGFLS